MLKMHKTWEENFLYIGSMAVELFVKPFVRKSLLLYH